MIADSAAMVGRMLLGRYRIVLPLAEGGMGIVYLGRVEGAAGFSRPVVIKTVVPHLKGDSRLSDMFVREARILANLHHPSIVGVLDFGEVDDAYVMVLEYVHGFHLGQWSRYLLLRRRWTKLDHAVFIATRVLEALHYAHELKRPDGATLGIVHRDVSVANILIDVDGQVKLHDFGIARMSEGDQEYKTQPGSIKGTFSFTAPEIFRGFAATPQSDLFSCAVVLYQIISGTNPFKGQHEQETLWRILSEGAPLLSSRRKDMPKAIDVAIARALSKDPAERFPSAAAFAHALRAGFESPEDEVATDFARTIREDFLGDLPEDLGLESLALRDQAWRDAQEGPPSTRVPLSSRPPSPADGLAAPEAVTVIDRIRTPASTTERTVASQIDGTQAPRRPWLTLGLALLALAISSTAGWTVLRGAPAAPAASFILIEKQRMIEPPGSSSLVASSAVPLPSAAAPASGSIRAAAPGSGPASQPAARGSPAHSAALFSQAFQKQQQAHVEGCFARFATDIEGQPRVLVRFAVDEQGTVQSAQISPPGLASSALGACILSHARKTQFGIQPEPTTFTIPITARRTR